MSGACVGSEGADPEFSRQLISLIPHLRAFARAFAGGAQDADDLAQEALARAWESRGSYAPGTNLKAWLFAILRNHHLGQLRRSWRQTPLDPEVAERTLVAPDRPDRSIALDQLRLALSSLNREQRETVVLIGVGGLTYEEVAEICDCPVGTVRSRLNRARNSLADLLEQGPLMTDGRRPSDALDAIHAESDGLARRAKATALG